MITPYSFAIEYEQKDKVVLKRTKQIIEKMKKLNMDIWFVYSERMQVVTDFKRLLKSVWVYVFICFIAIFYKQIYYILIIAIKIYVSVYKNYICN